jgi:hypothetical protein
VVAGRAVFDPQQGIFMFATKSIFVLEVYDIVLVLKNLDNIDLT